MRLYEAELRALQRAIYDYTRKCGVAPNVVQVHPSHPFAGFALALGLRVQKHEDCRPGLGYVRVEEAIGAAGKNGRCVTFQVTPQAESHR